MNKGQRITTIEQLASNYANSVKGYKLVNYYKGAFPIYRLSTEIIVQRKKELGVIQEFCLKFIRAQAKTSKHLSNFMGLSRKVIESNLMELHQLDMINFNFATQQIRLTDKGIETLENNNFIVPERIDYTFLIDGITGEYQLNESLDKLDGVKNNTHVIPFNIGKPDIDDISIRSIKNTIEENKRLNNSSYLDGDLLNISKIEKIEKWYRKFNVLVFANENGDIELQVYDKNKRCMNYESILIQMLDKKLKVIPTVEKVDEIDNNKSGIYDEYFKEAQENNELKKQIEALEESVEENIDLDVQTEEEFISKTMMIEELQEELLKAKEMLKRKPQILDTYEHRPILLKALKEAQTQVVIVSPWIKKDATDYELRKEIKNAMERNVKVVICYGISNEIEDNVKYALKPLEELKKEANIGKNLSLIKLGNTHEKVLVCDKTFVVITSFNWLSFKGDPKRGFRQETGTLNEDEEVAKMMLKNLQKRIDESGLKCNIII